MVTALGILLLAQQGAAVCCGWDPLRKRADRLQIDGEHLITEGFTRPLSPFRPQPPVADPKSVTVTYLGSGGFLIARGEAAILTAPYFSGNSMWRVGLWCLAVRPGLIDAYRPDLARVEAILVGHAHFDHLLDVPYLWSTYGRHTTVFGNRSAANILHGAHPRPATHVLEAEVRTGPTNGTFTATHAGAVQFMPLASSHAPNIGLPPARWGLKAMVSPWGVEEPLVQLPGRARDWRLGETLAYVIDLRDPADTARVAFRIYYQDAAHIPETWHHLGATADSVDLAIVTVASTNLIGQREYIRQIEARIKPRHWLLAHWEDFLSEYSQDPRQIHSVPLTDPEDFVRALRDQGVAEDRWVLPTPGTALRY